jgi:hypothetical protein
MHVIVKLGEIIFGTTGSDRKWNPHLGGTVEDSVNAMLGFAALYIPFATALFLAAMWFMPVTPGGRMPVPALGCVLGMIGSLSLYLPLALAAVHPKTNVVQAWMAFAIAYAIPIFVLLLASRVLSFISRPFESR